ncbi:MAG: hypothetical protein KC423_08145 [Anaerolineales bacterium]|nr:hypothetical protein [Anaerolineales bacterium]
MPNDTELMVVRDDEVKGGWTQAVEKRMAQIMEQAKSAPAAKLAEPLLWWEVFAIGPFQAGANTVPPADLGDQPLLPHRIIQAGEEATILTVVFLNPNFPRATLSACDIITRFGAQIELNYITSNMQTMQPAPELSKSFCLETKLNQCWYVHEYTFTPTEPACLYETNICARICNCDDIPIQPFGAFVRWVFDLDFDLFFGSPSLEFNRPIRFMVSDFQKGCQTCS